MKLYYDTTLRVPSKGLFLSIITKIIGIGVLCLLFTLSTKAFAATYYMRADGVAASKVEATSCTSAATAMSIATHNSQTFAGDDIIYLCNDGGNYTSILTPPSSGTSGHAIVYQNAPSQTVTFSGSSAQSILLSGTKSYITISGLNFTNTGANNILANGSITGITITGNSFNGSSSIALLVYSGANNTISNNTFTQSGIRTIHFYHASGPAYVLNSTVTNNTFNGAPGKTGNTWFLFERANGLTFSNNSISNYSSQNSFDKITDFDTVNGATISNNTFSNNYGQGFNYTSGSNIVSSNNSVTNQYGIAFNLIDTSATLTSDVADHTTNAMAFYLGGSSVIACNSCVASYTGGGKNGFYQYGSATVTFNNSTAHHNTGDGFNSNQTGSITCNKCSSYSNGQLGDSSSGDGYTSHDASTLNIRYSIAYGNYKSGVAVTGTSSGEVKNSTFYNNYEPSLGSGWDTSGDVGIGINATGTWVIKNNITSDHPVEMMITAQAVNGGVNVTSDYNNFYKSSGEASFGYNGTFSNFSTYKTSSNKDSHSLNVNPLFADKTVNNFKLQPTSVLINSGTDVSLTSDFLGNQIVGTPDLGVYEFQAPTSPSSLAQYKTDGVAIVASNGVIDTDSIFLKFNMASSGFNYSDSLTPQVEIQEIATTFTNNATHSGAVITYSGTNMLGTVLVSSLGNGKAYHWQARVANPAGQSSWVTMGGNPDFHVSIPSMVSGGGIRSIAAATTPPIVNITPVEPSQEPVKTSKETEPTLCTPKGITGSKSVKPGSTSKTDTKGVQQAINQMNILTIPLKEDGLFGTKTYTAIKLAQKKFNVSQDGAWGRNTQALYIKWLTGECK